MDFAARITRNPLAFDSDRGQAVLDIYPDARGALADLLVGTAGCSPFLEGLLLREADWMLASLKRSPEEALADVLVWVGAGPAEQLAQRLRIGKRRVALLCGLADLGGVWPLENVTQALTDYADRAVDLSLKSLVAAEIKRGKLPGMGPQDVATAGGMVVLAMGKMGAGELNYSSDIDLIVLFDETRFQPDDYHDARTSFIRVTRRMAAMLSDLTGDGYVFRTDLRLRPDPSVTPVCLAMETAERYYESVGRTWERAAHIKARPCAGDLAAGARYLARLSPFIWRRHLDFAAIQDAHDMRLRIRAHKRLYGPISLAGHNMKLGRGGIREIEFFTQTRQIIAGGRDKDLRRRETLLSLAVLAQKGWLSQDVADRLSAHYRFHREVEHRLQMFNDAQTHDLPKTDQGFDRLARFMGYADTSDLRRDLDRRLSDVHELTEGFFAPGEIAETPELSATSVQVIARWRTYPALRSQRAQEIFSRLKPELLQRFQRAAKPDEALRQFDGFLSGLPAGVQLFSLFESNPQLIDLMVDISATSPALSAHLSRNSQVFDAVIGGDFFAPWPGISVLKADLTAALSAVSDYEGKLDAARRWVNEWHFRIGVHHLRGLIGSKTAGAQYSDLAESVLACLWHPVVAEFSRKHGPPPGRGAVVLGMGSLGAGRLHSSSDLDLIVIYDAQGVEASDGRRPLAARAYYARLTQALVTALTAPMAEGKLYEVDMRLRPSGRQGPVATALFAFETYQQEEAWVWEHLALTRSRPVAGNADLGAAVEKFRAQLLPGKGAVAKVLPEVRDMRARIAAAKPMQGEWEAKLGPGRLQDIELAVQALCLMAGSTVRHVGGQLQAGVAAGLLSQDQATQLDQTYELMWRLRVASNLLTNGPLSLDDVGAGGRSFILRETGFETIAALSDGLLTFSEQARLVIEAILSSETKGMGQ